MVGLRTDHISPLRETKGIDRAKKTNYPNEQTCLLRWSSNRMMHATLFLLGIKYKVQTHTPKAKRNPRRYSKSRPLDSDPEGGIVVKRTTTVLRGLTPFFEILFYISM